MIQVGNLHNQRSVSTTYTVNVRNKLSKSGCSSTKKHQLKSPFANTLLYMTAQPQNRVDTCSRPRETKLKYSYIAHTHI